MLRSRRVLAVLAQVALVPRRLDLLRDIDAPLSREVVELGLEPVDRLLGQPGDGFFTRLGHGSLLGTAQDWQVRGTPVGLREYTAVSHTLRAPVGTIHMQVLS